jgi:3-hydroxymyristoyl/3-hydroxydecanoyl-(acyl carrier protein) dehydratase
LQDCHPATKGWRRTSDLNARSMDGHFRAFSFVDRITSIEPGIRVRGIYHIPPGIDDFPIALAAEASGQLAAWMAMAALDFKVRPVAGIAPIIELLSSVNPGQILELDAEIESLDAEVLAYSGNAKVNGTPVLRLQHCVGPMVPLEDYDDPQAVKNRFELLCGTGVPPGGFGGVPPIALDYTGNEIGKSVNAILRVPQKADLFLDHFPRRPVFPGTLFMHKVLELAARVAEGVPAPAKNTLWVARKINDAKLRVFIPPGDNLEFEARLAKHENNSITVNVEARKEKKITGHARIVFLAESRP